MKFVNVRCRHVRSPSSGVALEFEPLDDHEWNLLAKYYGLDPSKRVPIISRSMNSFLPKKGTKLAVTLSNVKVGKRYVSATIERALPTYIVKNANFDIYGLMYSKVFRSIPMRSIKNLKGHFGHHLGEHLRINPDNVMDFLDLKGQQRRWFVEDLKLCREFAYDFQLLNHHDIKVTEVIKVCREMYQQGMSVSKALARNPYALDRVIRFGQLIKLALNFNSNTQDPARLRFLSQYFDELNIDSGSVCGDHTDVMHHLEHFCGIKNSHVMNDIARLTVKLNDSSPLASTQNPSFFDLTETDLAKAVAKYAVAGRDYTFDASASAPSKGGYLHDDQVEAIDVATKGQFTLITGGPGAGKTTVARTLVESLINEYGTDFTVALAAPTGKAAERLSESVGLPATTIHKLIKYNPTRKGTESFELNIETDAVLVDEISMADMFIMRSFFMAVSPKTRVILVGDRDQLPSVSAGDLLNDLIRQGVLNVGQLKGNRRIKSDSSIGHYANQLKDGIVPNVGHNRYGDFHFIESNSAEHVQKVIISLCEDFIPNELSIAPMDIQVLTPQHETPVGDIALNYALQSILNPKHPDKIEFRYRGKIFREKDRILVRKNDGKLGLINGGIGEISSIDVKNKQIVIDLEHYKVTLPYSRFDYIDHAFAKTIHKSQGSEYPVIIVPVVKDNLMMLNRKLAYTATTRGKAHVFFVGSKKVLQEALDIDHQFVRKTLLTPKVSDAILAEEMLVMNKDHSMECTKTI
ncbi:ATP-dependent RecD-like DNA helicase [Vibrio splendidus]